jgi:hypothetical protein
MSKPALTSRFFVGESDSESEPEPPPKDPPRLTPKQKKKLERQMRFDEEQQAQKETQAAEAAERHTANKERRERKARAQQQREAAAGGASIANCTPEVFQALAILGLTPAQNTLAEINRVWRALSLEHHPDKGGDEELCKRINGAHDYLVEHA